MPYYTNEILDYEYENGLLIGSGFVFLIYALFVFDIMPIPELNWLARIYLAGGLITFILRLKRNKAEFFKELGCAFKSHGSNFWTTLIFWPFELIALAFGCKCSFKKNYSFTEFHRIMHKSPGMHNVTASKIVDEKIEKGEKEAERFVNDMICQARRTTAVVGSGAMITFSQYAFAKGTPPKADEEVVSFQMIVWGDFMHDRQLWLKLRVWYLNFWQHNRWPIGQGAPTSYIGSGFKIPLFARSFFETNFGPQTSENKVNSFAFFANLVMSINDWQIILANRAQKNFFNEKVPWVLIHIQLLKTPLISWLGLKVDQSHILNELKRLRIGPEFSFPTNSMKYFRFWPSYDFIQQVPDVRLQFQYSF